MKKDIADRWVAALRSGEYKQGRGVLKEGGYGATKHCCLGVLCELHSKETNTPWDEGEEYLEEAITLPDEVIKWAGMNNELRVPYEKHYCMLAELNDGHEDLERLSFPQIADLIEQNSDTL